MPSQIAANKSEGPRAEVHSTLTALYRPHAVANSDPIKWRTEAQVGAIVTIEALDVDMSVEVQA